LFVAHRLARGSGAKWSEFRSGGRAKTPRGEAKFVGPRRRVSPKLALIRALETLGYVGHSATCCVLEAPSHSWFFSCFVEGAQNSPTLFCASSTDQVRIIIGYGFCACVAFWTQDTSSSPSTGSGQAQGRQSARSDSACRFTRRTATLHG
jgi:hypothetical protein